MSLCVAAAQLEEASNLWEAVEAAATELGDWMDGAAPVVKTELDLTDPEQIAKQLDDHKVRLVVEAKSICALAF